MAAYFFDSSALAKSYIAEIGTAWVRVILAPAAGHDAHGLRIAEVEVTSAIVRRCNAGTLSMANAGRLLQQFRHDFANEFFVLELPGSLLASALSKCTDCVPMTACNSQGQ